MIIKFLIFISFLLSFSIVSAGEVIFNNPTFVDIDNAPYLNTSSCSNNLPIGNDESDTNAADWVTAEYFCSMNGYGMESFIIDNATSDPDVCETNSNTNPSDWRFDSSSTNVYTQIICNDGESTGTGNLDQQILNELQSFNSSISSSNNQQSFIIEFYIFFATLTIFVIGIEKWLQFFLWLEPKWNLLRFFKK